VGEKWSAKDTKREGIQEKNVNKKGGAREIASDLTQEQLTFPSWPGNNYVLTL